MNCFVTSDLHLGHENIIKYCNRPFKDGNDMNTKLIHNWNQRVKKEDTVYHLGDFCFKGGMEGGVIKALFWEKQLNGKIIFLRGNHDNNNSVKTIMTSCILEFGRKIIYVIHIPPNVTEERDKLKKYIPVIPDYINMILVGHVHEKWKYQWYNNKVPVVNVGVDVWNFRPVKLQEIIVFADRMLRGKK